MSTLTLKKDSTTTATYSYTYDDSGNITGKYVYAYTTGTLPSAYQDHISYGYSTGAWGDMLTSYNGTTISYDTIGNPTNWRNGITNLTWNGRELNSFVKGSYTHSFKYNADGIRTEQTKWYTGSSMAEIYHYVLDGTKIVSEYTTTSSSSTPSNVKYYFYDAAGSIAGFEYNGTTYYFQKNLQGDIIRICNISGNTVVEYTYDAWGKVLSVTGSLASTVGQINPFRYRGYYYDTETGFYYLQTRYYDPEVGRFLNADGYIGANGDIPGYNMFAYCSNEPVFNSDNFGMCIYDDEYIDFPFAVPFTQVGKRCSHCQRVLDQTFFDRPYDWTALALSDRCSTWSEKEISDLIQNGWRKGSPIPHHNAPGVEHGITVGIGFVEISTGKSVEPDSEKNTFAISLNYLPKWGVGAYLNRNISANSNSINYFMNFEYSYGIFGGSCTFGTTGYSYGVSVFIGSGPNFNAGIGAGFVLPFN